MDIPFVCNLFGLNLLHRPCNNYLLTLTRRSRRRVLRPVRHIIRAELPVCREGRRHALMCSSLLIQHSTRCTVELPSPACVSIACIIFFSVVTTILSSLPSPSSMMSRVVSRQLVLFCANQHVSMKVLQREAEFAIADFISDWH